MARSGVTYLDVAKTAIKLVEQKIYPTIEEVRKSLGTGSNSTINKYLREWRSKHGNQAELEQGLPEPLLIAVRGIYDGIHEAASNKVSLIENESRSAMNELKARLAEAETQHTKFIQTNTSLENSIQEQKEENLALKRQLSKMELELNKKIESDNILQELLVDKKIEVANLHQQLKNTQNNLDHYRETVSKTHAIEHNLLNEKIKSLEKQLYQQQVTLTKATEEITNLSRENKLLEDTKHSISQELNEKSIALQEQKHLLQLHTTSHNETGVKYENILADKAKLTNELNAEKATILGLTIDLEKAQERIAMFEYSLEKAETRITAVSDKYLFLVQEKTELSFQLKQMQSSIR